MTPHRRVAALKHRLIAGATILGLALLQPIPSLAQHALPAPRSTSLPLQRLLHPAFVQLRLLVDEHIVTDPYIRQEFRIWWIAPNRLRTDVYGTNLHVGTIGCVLGNFWVCGPDSAPHMPELQKAIIDAIFPQRGSDGYCCLRNLQIHPATNPNAYTVTATGDPWLYPLGCMGCDLPGTDHRPTSSEHYRATLTLDAAGLPRQLTSTIHFDPVTTSKRKLPGETRAPR